MKPFISKQIILKYVSKCTNRCTYCHWFVDPEVKKQPAIMPLHIEDAFLLKLKKYLIKYNVKKKSIILHGGEALLAGKKRIKNFANKVSKLNSELDCFVTMSVATNGVLIDTEWAQIFKDYKITPSITIDGPKEVHDQNRVMTNGNGTFDLVIRGLSILRSCNLDYIGVLTVCNLNYSPEKIVDFFVSELKLKNFDILIPNYNWDNYNKGQVKAIAQYYIKLFDLWYERYMDEGVKIRLLTELVAASLNRKTMLNSIGLGPMGILSIQPDGSMEPHDVLRLAGAEAVNTGLNVLNDELDDVFSNRVWMEPFYASTELPEQCNNCELKNACGGGYLIHRFSSKNRYANPSIYCEDYKQIFKHIWEKVQENLYLVCEAGSGSSE